MTTRKDIVDLAMEQNGYHDGQGYDESCKYIDFFTSGAFAYCDVFIAWLYEQCGIPLPKMGTWIRSGSQYCPESWWYAVSHGATTSTRLAQPGDQVIFNWLGNQSPLGGQSHTELVTGRVGDWLYTIGGNSGPSNVDGYQGVGGVHRHVWHVDNTAIQGIIDTGKLVSFNEDEFVMDDEAKAAFAGLGKQLAGIQLGITQLVKVFEGKSPETAKFGIEGIKDLDDKLRVAFAHIGYQGWAPVK